MELISSLFVSIKNFLTTWGIIVTFVIALWGAILSIIHQVEEWMKIKENLIILLVLVEFVEQYKITLLNPTNKPITINSISLSLKNKNQREFDPVPTGAMFSEQDKDFPITLVIGEPVDFHLSSVISECLFNGSTISISVFDSECNIYTKYKRVHHNIRFGGFYDERRLHGNNIKSRIQFFTRKFFRK